MDRHDEGQGPGRPGSGRGAGGNPARGASVALPVRRFAKAFKYLARKLHAAGEIRARYSVHDLRHAFAVRLYQATHDVYQVEKALGHANVAVTETYLWSIGVAEI